MHNGKTIRSLLFAPIALSENKGKTAINQSRRTPTTTKNVDID